MILLADGKVKQLKLYTFECRCNGHQKVAAYDLQSAKEYLTRCPVCKYYGKLIKVELEGC